VPIFNWWRKPYLASFKAGRFDFVMLAVHLQWGTTAGRTAELDHLADWVNTFQHDELRGARDIIAVGDFNITSYDSDLYKAVSKHGLSAPKSLLKSEHGSNLAKNKRYDQILHHPTITGSRFSEYGGVLDFYKSDHKILAPYSSLSKTKFTYELSDHLPLWCQLNVDVADDQLEALITKRSQT
jgi:endonuclease/exonuclease/phosphatase family metal-dependent hydrolase